MLIMHRNSTMRAIVKLGLIYILASYSVVLSGQSINWLSWEEAMAKSEVEKKKMIVDIYTDWCGWCKKMDQTTFSDSVVVQYINKNYYAIKFDAEYQKPIKYNDKLYKFESGIWKGGHHELALVLMNGKVKLPSVVFLDEDGAILQSIPGYRNALEMELMAAYFNGNYHHSTPWKNFVVMYQNEKTANEVQKQKISVQTTHTRLVIQKN